MFTKPRSLGSIAARDVAEGAVELGDRHDAVAEVDHGQAADRRDGAGLDPQRLDDAGERQAADPLAAADEHRADDREGQRQREDDAGALAGRRPDLDPTADALDVGAHDVHPHAAAGDVGDPLRRGEAGQEDDAERVRLRQRGGLRRRS